MTQDSVVIELQSVGKSFGQVRALDAIDLELYEGEFFTLLGPSGCGKTTLLRTIAGFEIPDSGRVLLDTVDITQLRPNRRPVNLMFQSYALFPHLDVRSNIAYGLEMERLPRAEVQERTDTILMKTQLQSLATRKPDQLSGGQKQRVALARALVKQPRVLLLDEPLGALDRKLKESMQFELKRLQHEFGVTFVMVTHDQEEAMTLSDRIALMQDGAIVQLGTPRNLYEQPANTFVAEFLGEAAMVAGTFSDGVLMTETHGALTLGAQAPLSNNASAVIALRPEQITLSQKTPVDGCNAIKGTVLDSAYRGQHINVMIDVKGCSSPLVVRLSSHESDSAAITAGQEIWCNWQPETGCLLYQN